MAEEETATGTGTVEKDEFAELLDLLCGFMKLMSDADQRRIVAREKLLDKKKMMRFNKQFRSLKELAEVHDIIRHDSQKFIEEREALSKKVEKVNKDGAEIIRKLEVSDNRERPIIIAVLELTSKIVKFETSMTAEEKEADVEKLKGYVPQLEAEPFKDKESAEVLKKLIDIIKGTEIEVLETFIEDVRHWLQWIRWGGGQRVDFFIGRIRQYLHGAEGVKGLEKDFKDNGVVKRIKENDAVKNLATFKKQIELFDNIFNYLKQMLETKVWTADFKRLDGKVVKMPFLGENGFHYNLTKGENYIGIVEKKFGNKRFAKVLTEFEKKTHEQPEKWEEEFAKLERILKNPKYEEEHIIMPASKELEQIFMKRVDEIKKGKDKEIIAQKKLLEKKKNEIDNASDIASKDFKKIVMKKKSKTYKRWERVKRKFEERESRLISRSVRFSKGLDELDQWLKFGDAYAHIQKEHKIKRNMTRFMSDAVPKIARSGKESEAIGPYVGGLIYAGGVLAEKEDEIVSVLNQITQDNPSLIMKLRALVPEARIIYRRYERLLKMIDLFEEDYVEEGKTPKELETPEAAAVARPVGPPEAAAKAG